MVMSKSPYPLEQMTLRQLRRVASEYGVSRYSRMRKSELIAAIQKIEANSAVHTSPSPSSDRQEEVEATKYDVGQPQPVEPIELTGVDAELPELPEGYGESRIVLLPRDPQWAYVYWDVPGDHKQALKSQGGQLLALRFYDVTDLDLNYQAPHSLQEYPCDELARDWYLPVPVSDRDYLVEIGYRAADGRWLLLARSAPVRVPPVYPSDWIEDHFITVNWDEDLRGQTVFQLVPPSQKASLAGSGGAAPGAGTVSDEIFALSEGAESMRLAGSLYGSQHMRPVHEETLSSYVFPSGVGMWALPTASGLTQSGVGMVGFSASLPLERQPRKFWLVADAELIIYGATEPDATVTIGGKEIKLSPDGTFRFQMSFQDGVLDFPIEAVAVDGEQTRSIRMTFNRETTNRRTNTKEEAQLEWFQ